MTFLTPRTISWLYFAVSTAALIVKLIPFGELGRFTKPLLMPLLLFYIYQKSIGNTTLKILFLSGAVLFSWLGDVALMHRSNEIYFILGIVLFSIAQILYLVTLRRASYQAPAFYVKHLLPFIFYGGAFFYILLPAGNFTIPIIAYGLTSMAMTFTAYSRKNAASLKSYRSALLGSILFILSGSVLLINAFKQPIPYAGFFMILTYCMAQFFLVSGILKHAD